MTTPYGISRGRVITDSAGNEISPATSTQIDALLPPRPTLIPANADTYRAVGNAYTAYATPTDMIELVGSDTKTVAVVRVILFPGATAATKGDFYFIRRSAANTGGTKAAQTAVKHDSASPAATAVVNTYSVIPAGLGASAGTVDVLGLSINATTSVPSRNGLSTALNHGPSVGTDEISTPIILRGVAESLVVNFNGAAIPAGFTTGFIVEWVEF